MYLYLRDLSYLLYGPEEVGQLIEQTGIVSFSYYFIYFAEPWRRGSEYDPYRLFKTKTLTILMFCLNDEVQNLQKRHEQQEYSRRSMFWERKDFIGIQVEPTSPTSPTSTPEYF